MHNPLASRCGPDTPLKMCLKCLRAWRLDACQAMQGCQLGDTQCDGWIQNRHLVAPAPRSNIFKLLVQGLHTVIRLQHPLVRAWVWFRRLPDRHTLHRRLWLVLKQHRHFSIAIYLTKTFTINALMTLSHQVAASQAFRLRLASPRKVAA